MDRQTKQKIYKASTLIQDIESLNHKIKIYEEFKIDKELDCKISRTESENDYSYIQNIYVENKNIIIEVISKILDELKLEVKEKELNIKEILRTIKQ
jgi:ABC-type transporter lipoprotein component MlaA